MKFTSADILKLNPVIFFFLVFVCIPFPQGICQTNANERNVALKAEQNIKLAIKIQQKIQKDRSQWDQEKSALVLEYEQLLQQKQMLEKEHKILSVRQKQQHDLNQTLIEQKKETIRVANELFPFIYTIYEKLKILVAQEPVFLKEERTTRLATLNNVMNDPQITIAEKYRKVMEALFIEAEYGSTIEVYQDKILMGTRDEDETLGNIFRLGRVSLFFLSLDKNLCGVFNPQEGKWQPLPKDMLPAIRSAVEIGSKRRSVELLPLPIGRLVEQEGTL